MDKMTKEELRKESWVKAYARSFNPDNQIVNSKLEVLEGIDKYIFEQEATGDELVSKIKEYINKEVKYLRELIGD